MADFETIVFFRDKKKSFNKHKRNLSYALSDIWLGIKKAAQSRITRHFRSALSQIWDGIKNIVKTAVSAIITTLFFPLFFLISALIDIISIPHRIWAWATKKSATEPKSVANMESSILANTNSSTPRSAPHSLPTNTSPPTTPEREFEIGCTQFLSLAMKNRNAAFKMLPSHPFGIVIAAGINHIDLVLQLLNNKINIDTQDPLGNTALMVAIDYDHIPIVLLLLSRQAQVNIKNLDGNTALMLASFKEKPFIVNRLLMLGAKVNVQNNKKATALMAAVCNNNEKIVSLLLGKQINNNAEIGIDIQDQHGHTALILAIFYGHTKVAMQLLQANAKLDIQDMCGNTALITAAFIDQIDIARPLLEKGAAYNIKNHMGDTALNAAAFHGHEHIVELLLKKDGVQNELVNIEGRSALITASIGEYKNIVSLLLAYKADVNIQDKYGYTAFAYATEEGYTEIANLIKKSENYKVSPNKPKSLAEMELLEEGTLLLFSKNANNPLIDRYINEKKCSAYYHPR